MTGGEVEQRLEAPRAAGERVNSWRERWTAVRDSRALRRPYLAWGALALICVAAAVLLFHETRGTTFWFDEWQWITHRRGNDLATFLKPHNGHFSLVPIAVYRLLFATAGLGDYAPYRAVVIALDLVSALLVFVYARRRVGDLPALCGAALLLFLGPAWQTTIWPFGITYLLSVAAGLGALLLLDRRDRAGDVGACLLIAVSLASSGLGMTIAVGAIIEVAWTRRSWRYAWIVAIPVALYALWWAVYQDAAFVRHDLVLTPGFVAGSAAAALSALLGLGGQVNPAIANDPGTFLAWGAPLAVAAVALVAWRLRRPAAFTPRLAALLAILVSFWILTGVGRAYISTPYASRYLAVSGLFVILVAAELARGVRLRPAATLVLVVVAAVAVASNIGALRDGARYLRANGAVTSADLAALEIGRPLLKPSYVASMLPGYPFVVVTAGQYFAAARAHGTPADTPAELARAPEPARLAADTELVRIHGLALSPPGPAARGGPSPRVDSVGGGTAAAAGSCVRFSANPVAPPGAASTIDLTLPTAGVVVSAAGAPASVSVRRFAQEFQPLGQLAASSSSAVRTFPDRSAAPWHVRVSTPAGATVCGTQVGASPGQTVQPSRPNSRTGPSHGQIVHPYRPGVSGSP